MKVMGRTRSWKESEIPNVSVKKYSCSIADLLKTCNSRDQANMLSYVVK